MDYSDNSSSSTYLKFLQNNPKPDKRLDWGSIKEEDEFSNTDINLTGGSFSLNLDTSGPNTSNQGRSFEYSQTVIDTKGSAHKSLEKVI